MTLLQLVKALARDGRHGRCSRAAPPSALARHRDANPSPLRTVQVKFGASSGAAVMLLGAIKVLIGLLFGGRWLPGCAVWPCIFD